GGRTVASGNSVAGARDRLDQRRVAELAAQAPERDAHRVLERLDALVPEPPPQALGAEDAAVGAEQLLEQVELARREPQGPTGTPRRPCPRVELQIGSPEHWRRRSPAPASARSRAPSSASTTGLTR